MGDAGFEGVGGADEGVGGNEGTEGSAAVVRRRSRTHLGVLIGIVWVVVPLALFLMDRSILLSGNPAHVIALAACGLVGVVLLVNDKPDERRRHRRQPRWRHVLGQVLGVAATVVVLGALVWLRPFAATPAAVSALTGASDVRVTDAAASITLAPRAGTPVRGLVFQPGARVDPRAYVPMLSQVSRQGVLVVIVKQPFDIGLLATPAPQSFVDEHPEVQTWAVGGHSLGGVAAARFALDHPRLVKGLVLWASYPDQSLAGRTDLQVASVSGTRDAFTTPADVAASRAMLPRTTAYIRVEGAVHSFFGDYGQQPGDGSPTVSRAEAQRQVVDATVHLMLSL